MTTIVPFNFDGAAVRALEIDNEPYFVGKDVAGALGYSDATTAIRSHCRGVQKLHPISDSLGRMQETRLLSEPDVLRLIVNSTLPAAERFERWVFEEVLPSIRKTGSYSSPKAAPSPVRLAYDAAKAFPPLFRVARLLGCDKNAAAISANQMVRKLTDVNLLEGLGQVHLEAEKQDTQFFTPTELGKRIGASARGVNLLLAEAGMQMKRGDVWEVTDAGREFARILDTGKKHGSGVPIQQVKWSPNVLPLLGSEKEAA
ncbi:Bro-N domain-containing protein [Variovorax sp. S2]|uniref:BRO-N domain-containing protein n=1 Tax=Variovorax sp. S12S4 TaxID=3029170 RepID=UPI00215D3DA0|nr:Bro-N domain-containing protein [Variovorax sp. S12S4]